MRESDGVEYSKERRLPFVPRQDAITDSPGCSNDLTRDMDDRGHERAEVHGQKPAALLQMLWCPAWGDRHEQRDPCLQRPGQSSHDHVCPVGVEGVDRRVKGTHTALELCDQILLIASLPCFLHDLVA